MALQNMRRLKVCKRYRDFHSFISNHNFSQLSEDITSWHMQGRYGYIFISDKKINWLVLLSPYRNIAQVWTTRK